MEHKTKHIDLTVNKDDGHTKTGRGWLLAETTKGGSTQYTLKAVFDAANNQTPYETNEYLISEEPITRAKALIELDKAEIAGEATVSNIKPMTSGI